MKRILIFLLVMSILVLPGVMAVPPFIQGNAFTEGYEIQFPAEFDLVQNQNYTFSFHVFNISNGKAINETNSATTCNFHLFDNASNHLVQIQKNTVADFFDYKFLVVGGNFSTIGSYSYIIQCEDQAGDLGGFESVEFYVTANGQMAEEADVKFYIGIIFFFLSISILLFIGFYKEGKWQMKMTYGLFSYVFFIIALNIIDLTIKSLVVNPSLLAFFDSILAVSFIIMWFFIVMVLVIWIITLFQTLLLRQAKLKIDKFH